MFVLLKVPPKFGNLSLMLPPAVEQGISSWKEPTRTMQRKALRAGQGRADDSAQWADTAWDKGTGMVARIWSEVVDPAAVEHATAPLLPLLPNED